MSSSSSARVGPAVAVDTPRRCRIALLGSNGSLGRPRAAPPGGPRLESGTEPLEALAARPDLDLLIVGSGGMVSLRPVLAALRAGTPVATANKETLVAGGHLVMPLADGLSRARAALDPADPLGSTLGWIRPIDSEHSAIWQCLVGEGRATVSGA